MAFTLAGSTITQTGTDTNLSGLSSLSGVTVIQEGSKKTYKFPYDLIIDGNLTMNAQTDAFVLTSLDGGVVVNGTLSCSGSLGFAFLVERVGDNTKRLAAVEIASGATFTLSGVIVNVKSEILISLGSTATFTNSIINGIGEKASLTVRESSFSVTNCILNLHYRNEFSISSDNIVANKMTIKDGVTGVFRKRFWSLPSKTTTTLRQGETLKVYIEGKGTQDFSSMFMGVLAAKSGYSQGSAYGSYIKNMAENADGKIIMDYSIPSSFLYNNADGGSPQYDDDIVVGFFCVFDIASDLPNNNNFTIDKFYVGWEDRPNENLAPSLEDLTDWPPTNIFGFPTSQFIENKISGGGQGEVSNFKNPVMGHIENRRGFKDIRVYNSSTGSSLILSPTENTGGNALPLTFGGRIYQEFQVKTTTSSGDLSGCKFHMTDTNNGKRKSLQLGYAGVTRDERPDRIYSGMTDNSGLTPTFNVLTAVWYRENAVNRFTPYPDGNEIVDLRGKTNVKGEDFFDAGVIHYNYLIEPLLDLKMANPSKILIEKTMVVDPSIKQTDKTVVDAYTSIDNSEMLYDRAKAWLYDNYEGGTVPIVKREGVIVNLGDWNITVDKTASAAFTANKTSKTITIKSDNFQGDVVTTGAVVTQNGAVITPSCSEKINAVFTDLKVVNDNVKDSSKLIPANRDLPSEG